MAPDLLRDHGEQEIIKMLADEFGIEDLDDAAAVDEHPELLSSGDMMFQSTDLPSNTSPLFWGHRFIAANVSDMSGMGCRPICMMVSLGLPGEMETGRFRRLLEGMTWACSEAEIRIIGGDTNSSPEVVLSGFIVGTPYREPLLRSGARPGDGVYVTGRPGMSALGLALIQSREDLYFDTPDLLEEDVNGSAEALGAFLAPDIRTEEAQYLSETGEVSSCIDVSDGISTDAGHISQMSGVGIVIDQGKLPISPLARGLCETLNLDPVDLALNGGDDFELLFTAPMNLEDQLLEDKIAVRIGEVERGHGTRIRRPDGNVETLKSGGYQHLSGEAN
jgi:thiamine-monophosphate kinase